MVFESSSTADPHLDPESVGQGPLGPTAPPPVVPMKLPSADPSLPVGGPDPEFPPFPVYRQFPDEEITRQMQLLC
jgi:hypothetical protein